ARADLLGGRTNASVNDADVAGDSDVAGSAAKQAKVMRQLRCLERAMTPEPGDDRAWHHPLEYIQDCAAGRHVLFLKPAVDVFHGDEFSNGQKFEFLLLEGMAERGFRHWLYPHVELHLGFLHEWLKERRDSRSLKALMEVLQQYLTWPM